MKLKISLFNKTIIKSDLKRFWWVSALYTVILFFALPLQHMMQVLPINEDWQKQALLNSLQLSTNNAFNYRLSGFNLQVILICTLPVFLAVMLFSYLHSTQAATMLHSLPLNRKTLFGSHISSGLLLISAPAFITAVFLSVLATFTGLGEYYAILNVVEWLGLTLLFNVVFFSIAVFVGMFTGNAIAHIVFTYIINVLPYGLYMITAYNLEKLIYGFSMDRLNSKWAEALPMIKIVEFRNITYIQGLFYLITALVLLGTACLAYDRRKLEAAGNIIAFRTVQPVFKYGVVVCLVLSGGFFTGFINHSGRTAVIITYFLFAFVGYWVSQMLLEKTVRVWHAYKGFLILNAVIILMLAGMSADVTGYARYVPKPDEVKSAYFGNSYSNWLNEINKPPEADFFSTVGFFKEEANIKAVMSLHRGLANERNEVGGNEAHIAYELKNGKSIVRKYTVDENAVKELLKPLYESIEYKEDKYPVLSQKVQDIKIIEIVDTRTDKKPLILSDEKQMQSFMDIMKQELIGANYEEVTASNGEYTYIQIINRNERRISYNLRKSFTALYTWLKDNGHYESVILNPKDIVHIAVQATKVTRYKGGSYGYSGFGSKIDLNDSELIKELIDISRSSLSNANSGTYLRLDFYRQAGAGNRDFEGYIYPGTPMSEALLQKLGDMGRTLGTAAK